MRLSHTTIHILAKGGDVQADSARRAWLRLVAYIGSHVAVEGWYCAKSDTIEIGLTYAE